MHVGEICGKMACVNLCNGVCVPSARLPGLLSSLSPPVRTISRRRGGLSLGPVRAQAGQSETAGEIGTPGVVAIAAGLVANPVVGWSLFTLKTTGCGLPPGPGGAIGALEGVSYLAILGIISWSAYTKIKTGSGLPNGPFGLLGAVEGLSYLSVLAIAVVFGLQFLDYGYIPGPVPSEQCFG